MMADLDEMRLVNYSTGAEVERERIVKLIANVRDTWVRPPAHNYQRELTKLIALIDGGAVSKLSDESVSNPGIK